MRIQAWFGDLDECPKMASEETTNTQRFEEDSWLTSQSRANRSPGRIPCYQGKEQGILRKSGRLAKSRPSERSKISLLEDNSLEIGTGN